MSNNPDAEIVQCDACDGRGWFEYGDTDDDTCFECGGTGEIELGDTAAFL